MIFLIFAELPELSVFRSQFLESGIHLRIRFRSLYIAAENADLYHSPFDLSECSISSVRFRGLEHNALQEEWEAMTGAFDTLITS